MLFGLFFVRFDGDFSQIAQKYFFHRNTRLHYWKPLFPRKKQKCGSARGCFLVCIRSTWCPNGTKKTTPKHLFFLGRGGSVVPASPFDVLFYWIKQTNKTPKRRSRSSPARRVDSSRRFNSKSTFTGHCLPHSNDQSPEKLRGVFLQQTHRVTEDERRNVFFRRPMLVVAVWQVVDVHRNKGKKSFFDVFLFSSFYFIIYHN